MLVRGVVAVALPEGIKKGLKLVGVRTEEEIVQMLLQSMAAVVVVLGVAWMWPVGLNMLGVHLIWKKVQVSGHVPWLVPR